MILLQGFFRKKTTKLYLLLFSTLFISLVILFSFIIYFKNIANLSYSEQSEVIIVSKTKRLEDFKKIKEIVIEEAIVLQPNFDNKIICKVIDKNCDGNLYWEKFLNITKSKEELVVLIPSSRRNILLKNNQIAIGIPENDLAFYKEFGQLENFKNKAINFQNNEIIIEFNIYDFYVSKFYEMIIPDKDFSVLREQTKQFAYKGYLIDYQNNNLERYNLTNDKDIEFSSIKNSSSVENKKEELTNIIKLISMLKLISYLMIFMFIVIFIIVLRNIIDDESTGIRLQRTLGYTRNVTRKYLFLKLGLLNILTIIIGTILSTILIILIRFVSINLDIFNLNLLLKLSLSILFLSFIFCYSYFIANRN